MNNYRTQRNFIVDQDGNGIAMVVPISCSMIAACEMAAYAAQQMTHEERQRQLVAERKKESAS